MNLTKQRIAIIFSIILILWLALGAAPMIFLARWEERGTFGDMFGAVNAFFSGLALAGVVLAILMQKAELALQREELSLTREELKRSASAQESSTRELSEQVQAMKDSTVLMATSQLIAEYDRQIRLISEDNSLAGSTRQHQIEVLSHKREALLRKTQDLLENLLEVRGDDVK